MNSIKYLDMPVSIRGLTIKEDDYSTILLNPRHTHENLQITALHEQEHIDTDIGYDIDVDDIESLRHRME